MADNTKNLLIGGGVLVGIALLVRQVIGGSDSDSGSSDPDLDYLNIDIADPADFQKKSGAKTGLDAVLPYLQAASKTYGVKLSWLVSIAAKESNFNPASCNVVGPDGLLSGAWGMMQMTGSTAVGLGFDGNLPDASKCVKSRYQGSATGLMDPQKNANLAAQLIKQLLRSYSDLKDVAAAYNGGKSYWSGSSAARSYADDIVNRQKNYAYLDLASVA